MFNILVVEDDIYQRKSLIAMIKELGDNYLTFEADCEEDALKIATANRIDLFYIDVELKKSSGLELAKKIREKEIYKITWIVFITTYINHMLQAFREIHCYDYILKPYDKDKIKETTITLLRNKQSGGSQDIERKYIVFNSNGIDIKCYVDEIVFIEIRLRTASIHTKDIEFDVKNIPLKDIRQVLEGTSIRQFHKSYLINVNYISKIDKTKTTWEVYFESCDMTALISRSYRGEFENVFGVYCK